MKFFECVRSSFMAALVVVAAGQASAALDLSFDDPTVNGDVNAITLQADGKILIGGQFSLVGGVSRPALARLNPDGTHDLSFTPTSISGVVRMIVIQLDGKVLVGGSSGFKRLLPTGAVDPSFSCTVVGDVYTGCLQPDGKIVIAGSLTNVNGVVAGGIARLNDDGSREAGFAPIFDGTIYSIALQRDGRIVTGGSFSKIDGVNRLNLGRLLPDGTRDPVYNPSTNGAVRAVALDHGALENAHVGGDFTTVLGQSRAKVALVTNSGALDTRAYTNAGFSSVHALAIRANGVLFAAGQGTTSAFFGYSFTGLSSPPASTVSGAVGKAIAIQEDGAVFLGGSFQTLDSISRPSIGKLAGYPTAADFRLSAENLFWDRSSDSYGMQAPALRSVLFEVSDNGVTGWVSLGDTFYNDSASPYVSATAVRTGQYVRARGFTQSGFNVELIKQVDIPNRSPLAADIEAQTIENRPVDVVLSATDADGDTLVYDVVSAPTKGVLSGTGPILRYTPKLNAYGDDGFTYRVSDGDGESAEASVSISIERDLNAPQLLVDLPEVMLWPTGSSQTLGVELTGGRLEFQWFFNGKSLRGQKAKDLLVPTVALSHAGTYMLEITNDAGTVRSRAVRIFVAPDSEISYTIPAGGSAPPLNATVAGPAGVGFSYQWVKGGIDLADVPGRISGASTATLKVSAAIFGDSGAYTCRVTTTDPLQPQLTAGTWTFAVPGLPPLITDAAVLPVGIIGTEYLHPIKIDPSPEKAPQSFVCSRLPSGLVFDAKQGIIHGRPKVAVTNLTVEVRAQNAEGSSGVHSYALTVLALPRGAIGSFVATVGGAAVNTDDGGRLDVVTTGSGTFTAKLDMLGIKRTASGVVTSVAQSGVVTGMTGACKFKASGGREEVSLTFNLNAGVGSLVGKVTGGNIAAAADVSGYRNGWGGANAAANPYAGYFTAALVPPSDDIPLGEGFMTLKVQPTGAVTVSGRLSDTTPFTMSAIVGPDGQIAGLYWWNPAAGGSLTSTPNPLPFITQTSSEEGGPPRVLSLDGLSWRKEKTSFSIPGFPRLALQAFGAEYLVPPPGQGLMDAENTELNMEIRFLDPSSNSASARVAFTILNTSRGLKVTMPKSLPLSEDDPNPYRVKFQLLGANSGLFQGSFSRSAVDGPEYLTSNYYGIIVYDPDFGWNAVGHYLEKYSTPPELSVQSSSVRLEQNF